VIYRRKEGRKERRKEENEYLRLVANDIGVVVNAPYIDAILLPCDAAIVVARHLHIYTMSQKKTPVSPIVC